MSLDVSLFGPPPDNQYITPFRRVADFGVVLVSFLSRHPIFTGGHKIKTRAVYIDENDTFNYDPDVLMPWYKECHEFLESQNPDPEDVFFLIFLMGCEAALRCQQQEETHH